MHNIIFSDDYAAEFEDIFVKSTAPRDPTIYINISSKGRARDAPHTVPHDAPRDAPHDAPPGMENWFVMINVPAAARSDWGEIAKQVRAAITQKISAICGVEITPHISHEKILTPTNFAAIACDEYGSLYGRNAHGILGAFSKPQNASRRYKNLYYCGGTAHPGGGIPLALLSGQIAASYSSPQSISLPTLEY